MKKEYDLKKMKGVVRKPLDPAKVTIPVSMRIEMSLVLWATKEGEKLGMGYQTFLKMKLHQAMNESTPKKSKAG